MSRSQSFAPVVTLDQSLDEAFPAVDPNYRPFGSRVLVQLRSPRNKTAGVIVLAQETQDNIQGNTQVAKVIAMGTLAFHNRTTGEEWPEGAWAKIGDYVRVPKFGGDTWEVKIHKRDTSSADDGVAIFKIFNALDISGEIPGDPLAVVAYV